MRPSLSLGLCFAVIVAGLILVSLDRSRWLVAAGVALAVIGGAGFALSLWAERGGW